MPPSRHEAVLPAERVAARAPGSWADAMPTLFGEL